VPRLLLIGSSEALKKALLINGYDVVEAANFAAADERLGRESFTAIVSMHSGMAAHAWCVRTRAAGGQWPIVLITGEVMASARVRGLESGADNVLPKTLPPHALCAHLRALARRDSQLRTTVVVRDSVRLDLAVRRAWVADHEVVLTAGEWRILCCLEANVGRAVRRDVLLRTLRAPRTRRREASIEVLIGRIRKKLGADAIRTIRGVGYRVGE
jgi:DNA-binding response OmpR family regulator